RAAFRRLGRAPCQRTDGGACRGSRALLVRSLSVLPTGWRKAGALRAAGAGRHRRVVPAPRRGTSAAGHPWRGDASAGGEGPWPGAGRAAAGRGRAWPAVTPATERIRGAARMPLLIALQFLTRLPVRLPRLPTAEESGRSLLWYPLVGPLLGTAPLLVRWLLGDVS